MVFGFNGNIVLCVGSDRMSLVAAHKYEGYTLLKGIATKEYEGYQSGEFVSESDVYVAVKNVVDTMLLKFGIKAKKITVGVPGEFTCAKTKLLQTEVGGLVRKSDIAVIIDNGHSYKNHPKFYLINANPLYYTLDSSAKKVLTPVGSEASFLKAKVSYILAEKKFIDLFDSIADRLGVEFEYTSSTLAEQAYLAKINGYTLNSESILVNIGYSGVTVSHGYGQYVTKMLSFAMGVINVAGDLIVSQNVPVSHALALTDSLNLNLNPTKAESYGVFVDGKNAFYSISKMNSQVASKIKELAVYIKNAVSGLSLENADMLPVYITGSNLCSLHGVAEIISLVIGRKIEVVLPKFLSISNAGFYSLAALLDGQKNTKRRLNAILNSGGLD